MNCDGLKRLISQPEGLKIDFKRDFYKITKSDYSQATEQQQIKKLMQEQWGEFIKDIQVTHFAFSPFLQALSRRDRWKFLSLHGFPSFFLDHFPGVCPV